jgi:hypothetical protein
MSFDRGVPEEFADQPELARFMRSRMNFPVRDAAIDDTLEYAYGQGFKIRMESGDSNPQQILERRITAHEDVRGPLAFYLALREVGLTIAIQKDGDGMDALVIKPADGKK